LDFCAKLKTFNNKNKMKKNLFLFAIVFCLVACKNNSELQNQTATDYLETAMDSVKIWDDFRMQIAQNDPDFDLLKHYESDKISENEINNLVEDEYTKSVINETTFDQLQDEIFDDQKAKALYVLVASQDITIGTIYYFQFTSNGLQLIGTMPY
jgi:hypothetical protein